MTKHCGCCPGRLYFFYRSAAFLCCFFITVYVASAQTISQAEYFFDVDPGRGNGTPIVISSPADTVNFTATISTTGLSGGLHYLFIRTRTSNGF